MSRRRSFFGRLQVWLGLDQGPQPFDHRFDEGEHRRRQQAAAEAAFLDDELQRQTFALYMAAGIRTAQYRDAAREPALSEHHPIIRPSQQKAGRDNRA